MAAPMIRARFCARLLIVDLNRVERASASALSSKPDMAVVDGEGQENAPRMIDAGHPECAITLRLCSPR